MVSLVWGSDDALELNVVPPVGKFGKPGRVPLNHTNPNVSGGTLDVHEVSDPGNRQASLESISWPQFLGGDPPPVGEYKVYVTTRSAPSEHIPWACRLKIGQRRQWYSG